MSYTIGFYEKLRLKAERLNNYNTKNAACNKLAQCCPSLTI